MSAKKNLQDFYDPYLREAKRESQERSRRLVRSGERTQESMSFIPRLLEGMIDQMNKTTAQASAAIDEALAFVEASNKRIAAMEKEAACWVSRTTRL